MMTPTELEQGLLRLGLEPAEATQLLGVTLRTYRRWLHGEEIPSPVAQAIRAWLRLHDHRLPWRPDSTAIVQDDQDQISRHRDHAVGLADIIARVEARGGPRTPWQVDRQRGRATLGPMEISFYTLTNGGFSLANYTRKDGNPDVQRDRELIDDATYCIAKEFMSGPVTLVYHDRPWRAGTMKSKHEDFPSKDAAIRRACAAMNNDEFHDAFIMQGKQLLLDKRDLWRECQRRENVADTLKAVANYVSQHSSAFARDGAAWWTKEQVTQQQQRIEAVGAKINALAESASQGTVTYEQFETLLGELHKLGFYPQMGLVSAVAHAFP